MSRSLSTIIIYRERKLYRASIMKNNSPSCFANINLLKIFLYGKKNTGYYSIPCRYCRPHLAAVKIMNGGQGHKKHKRNFYIRYIGRCFLFRRYWFDS